MKRANSLIKMLLSIFVFLQTLLLVLPAQAANRNDFLFDLKGTLNDPVSSKIGFTTILFLLIGAAIIWAIKYNSAREQEVQRSHHEMYQKKVHSQPVSDSQKRSWFRLKTTAEFKWIPAELAPNVKVSKYRTDYLIDVSGGGLSFTTAQEIKAGDDIKLILNLGEDNPLPLDAQVIRVLDNDEGSQSVSTKFVGLRDGQRDRIIAWILKNQRATNYNPRFEDKNLHPDNEYAEEEKPAEPAAAIAEDTTGNI